MNIARFRNKSHGPLSRVSAKLAAGENVTIQYIGDSTRTGDWCEHPEEQHRVVSDVVIMRGTYNDSDGAHEYEVGRQIIACHLCGRVVATPEVERPLAG